MEKALSRLCIKYNTRICGSMAYALEHYMRFEGEKQKFKATKMPI